MNVFLQFEARRRISAEVALRHIYFRELGDKVQDLDDSKYFLLVILKWYKVHIQQFHKYIFVRCDATRIHLIHQNIWEHHKSSCQFLLVRNNLEHNYFLHIYVIHSLLKCYNYYKQFLNSVTTATSIFSVKEIRLQRDPGKHFPAQRELCEFKYLPKS